MSYLVLIFGEDDTDRRAICCLIRAINNELPEPIRPIRTNPIRSPIILSVNATRQKRVFQARQIAAILKTEKTRYKRAIAVVHRDCDAVEPAHQAIAKQTVDELVNAGAKYVVSAAPAWEIEAWWMLFPEALAEVRSCWRRVDYRNQQVGVIVNAKEQLTRDLRPSAKERNRCRDYTERDGVAISEVIEARRLLALKRGQANDSFNSFISAVITALTG